MIFTMGENGNLRAWQLDDAGLRYLACSEEYASWQAPVPYGGMPGGMLTLSANGQAKGSAIVWVLMPALDANKVISPGRLLAYDAQNFGTYPDGSRKMLKLWDSYDWGINFTTINSTCRYRSMERSMYRRIAERWTFTDWPSADLINTSFLLA